MPPAPQPLQPDDTELFTFRGEGRDLRAVHRGGRPVALDTEGHEVRLSPAEEQALSEEAWSFSEVADTVPPPLARAFHRLWFGDDGLPPNPLAVMLDTTTFRNAALAIEGSRSPSAYELLDLSVVTVAVTFFDHVIIQPGQIPIDAVYSALPPERFPHVLHMLDPDPADEERLGQEIYASAVGVTTPSLRKARHEEAWAKLLRRKVRLDPTYAEPWHVERVYMSPPLPGPSATDTAFSEFATRQTVRAEFNDRVAGALKLPYLASSMRLAPASEMVSARRALLQALRQTARVVAPSERRSPGSTFAAPFLLGVVLNEMKERDDFGTVLSQLRDEFKAVRERLRCDPNRITWDEQPQALYDELPRMLESVLSPDTKPKGKFRMAIVKAALGAIPVVGNLLGSGVDVGIAFRESPEAARARARMRADLFALVNFSDQAANVRTLRAQVDSLWGHGMDDTRDDVLKQISEFNADPLLTPRALD